MLFVLHTARGYQMVTVSMPRDDGHPRSTICRSEGVLSRVANSSLYRIAARGRSTGGQNGPKIKRNISKETNVPTNTDKEGMEIMTVIRTLGS